jgi:glycerol kinase
LRGATTFALEGSIFHAGSVVQWLRDGLGLLREASDADTRARRADPRRRVYLVPAFTGLGAPWWRPDARGAIHGLTRDVTADDLVRAGLEAACHQTADLLDAAAADGSPAPDTLRVDGGMARSDWTMQALADLIGRPVLRPAVTETTALGAATLAGIGAGIWSGPEAVAVNWRAERRFTPAMAEAERAERRAGWRRAVEQTLHGA